MRDEKIAELLALPTKDRAFLARVLIASLDNETDAGAEEEWRDVIDRRWREIEEGRVECRPVEEVLRDIRRKLDSQQNKG